MRLIFEMIKSGLLIIYSISEHVSTNLLFRWSRHIATFRQTQKTKVRLFDMLKHINYSEKHFES